MIILESQVKELLQQYHVPEDIFDAVMQQLEIVSGILDELVLILTEALLPAAAIQEIVIESATRIIHPTIMLATIAYNEAHQLNNAYQTREFSGETLDEIEAVTRETIKAKIRKIFNGADEQTQAMAENRVMNLFDHWTDKTADQ